jgi:ribosomal protein S18 acetylase RimI-like enzyme
VNQMILRPFNGSLGDARGILAIDRATFNNCPYRPERIVRLLTTGEGRAWVAEVGGSVAGFVTAFPTRGLQADRWEIDLLAVHTQHQRQGIGTALIRIAVEGAVGSRTTRARAVVAVKNHISQRAFEAAGFEPLAQVYHLMRCDVAGAAPRPPVPGMEAVCPVINVADAKGVLRLAPPLLRTAEEVAHLVGTGSNILLAKHDGHLSAFVELIKVQTLLYAGVWVEMLVTPALGHAKRSRADESKCLIAAAVERTRAEGLDEIGCLVPANDWRLRSAFIGQGFASEGEYLVMTRALQVEP